ncbi:MAG: ABC-2 transporter permease, partial [Eubacteriales bacterium]
MLSKLISKEFRLALHPTSYIFILLSSMLAIPNYPYYVIFFYTGLAIFFTCLSGRENHDVFYSMTLPVSRRDIVRARFSSAVLLEIMQLAAAIPFAILRGSYPMPGNTVGMDANAAFFGFSLLMLGIFNLTFFTMYYRDVTKVGKAFVVASIVYFLA